MKKNEVVSKDIQFLRSHRTDTWITNVDGRYYWFWWVCLFIFWYHLYYCYHTIHHTVTLRPIITCNTVLKRFSLCLSNSISVVTFGATPKSRSMMENIVVDTDCVEFDFDINYIIDTISFTLPWPHVQLARATRFWIGLLCVYIIV